MKNTTRTTTLFLAAFSLIPFTVRADVAVDSELADDYSDLPTSADDVHPVMVSQEAPEATVQDAEGNPVKLSEVYEEKPTVVLFFRGGWCPYCNEHFRDIADIKTQLDGMGVQVVALTADSPKEIAMPKEETDKAGYKLYSDSKLNAARKFGVAFKVDYPTVEQYKKWNIDLEASSGENHHGLPVPSVFVVNKKGEVTFNYVNPDYKTRISNDLLLSALKDSM